MDWIQNIWNTISGFLSQVSFGSVLAYMSMGAGIFFGIDRWLLSHRKPKASLRFVNGKKEITLNTHYYSKSSSKYYLIPSNDSSQFDRYHNLYKEYLIKHQYDNEFFLSFQLCNKGKLQLENYRVEIDCEQGIGTFFSTHLDKLRKDGIFMGDFPVDGISIDNSQIPQIVFSPFTPHPLNQKDEQKFAIMIKPNPNIEKIVLHWHIIAKDFSDEGKFTIHFKPYTTAYDEIISVNTTSEIPEGAETVEDLTPYIQQMEELLKQ